MRIIIDLSLYDKVGCPSCGAIHKRFNTYDPITCYRCWRVFFAVDARVYEEYKKP